MCVIAHPDDECFAFGGALALAAERGVTTYVVCLTDGQAATYRGEARTAAELGRMRREEFAASCQLLGVSQYELLDYDDARLEFVDFSHVSGRLVKRMRSFQPDVVLTFGSDGGLNTHNDHMMVSALTTAAFHWAGRDHRYPEAGPIFQPRRLFHATTNFFIPGRRVPLPLPWTVKLDIRSVQQRKAQAFRLHSSQTQVMESTRALFEQHGHEEFYALIAAPGVQPAQLADDLFAGL
ncbi:MAG: PIG-L family deacetylase [Acidobacteriota bacterium]|nr:PIG-L family deacetylase [Acidobacteriota bacterium]